MGAKVPRGRRMFVYRVRSVPGGDLPEVLTDLTQRVWHCTEQRCRPQDMDPHLWPEVLRSFREIFRKRIKTRTTDPSCISNGSCLLCGAEHVGLTPSSVYLLEIPYSLDRFLKIVSSLLARRLRKGRLGEGLHRRGLRPELESSVCHGIKEQFFEGKLCSECAARGDGQKVEPPAEPGWVPIRRFSPEEVAAKGYREDM